MFKVHFKHLLTSEADEIQNNETASKKSKLPEDGARHDEDNPAKMAKLENS